MSEMMTQQQTHETEVGSYLQTPAEDHLQSKMMEINSTRAAEASGLKRINPKMNLIHFLAAAAQPELGLTLILLFLS